MAHEAIARPLFEADVASLTPQTSKTLKIVVISSDWPVLDVKIEHSRPLRLRFTCDNWDELPPAIQLLNFNGTPFSGTMPGGIFHPDRFICMRGVREYHQHPGHLNDSWDNYRRQDGMTIFGILQQIRQAWLRTK